MKLEAMLHYFCGGCPNFECKQMDVKDEETKLPVITCQNLHVCSTLWGRLSSIKGFDLTEEEIKKRIVEKIKKDV